MCLIQMYNLLDLLFLLSRTEVYTISKVYFYPVLRLLDRPNNHKIRLIFENDDVKNYAQ